MKTTLVVKRISKTKPLVEQKLEECARFSLENIRHIEAIGLNSFVIYCFSGVDYEFDCKDYYDYRLEFE